MDFLSIYMNYIQKRIYVSQKGVRYDGFVLIFLDLYGSFIDLFELYSKKNLYIKKGGGQRGTTIF